MAEKTEAVRLKASEALEADSLIYYQPEETLSHWHHGRRPTVWAVT